MNDLRKQKIYHLQRSTMSAEDVPSPSTYRDHLLSHSLVREMFRHNLVGAGGRFKKMRADLNRYRSALQRMYAERTAALYERRNQLVSEAEKILKIRSPGSREERRLKEILDELELELNDEEIPAPKEPLKVPRRYLGSSEPKLSIYERKLLEETQRNKVLKRDLRVLDDWLKEISTPIAKVVQIRRIPSLTWEDFQKKHYARAKKRVAEMNRARHNLVHDFNSFNENVIRKLVAARDSVERQRIYRSTRQLPVDARVPKAVKSDTATSVSASSTTPEDEGKSRPVGARVPKAVKSDAATSVSVSSTSPEDEDKNRPDDTRYPKAVKSDAASCVSVSSTRPEDEDKSRSDDTRYPKDVKSDAASCVSASSTTPEDEDKCRSADARYPKAVKLMQVVSVSSTRPEDEDKSRPDDARDPKRRTGNSSFCVGSSTTPEDEDKSRSADTRYPKAVKPDAASCIASCVSASSTTPEDEDKSRSADARDPKAVESDTAAFVSASSITPEDEVKSRERRSESLSSVPVFQGQETTEGTGTSEESEMINVNSLDEQGTSEESTLNSQLETSEKSSQNES
ncbi:hypothetical protein AVEN_198024-1 [Araneus ventricosus]|uniref:Uncharacterized protein n=1 Tax=Araneus ventricosus TaxID=182803 RepID=A0A4Y2KNH4_ARAVE|nr:hypothetical protein AVEN_198024-1 [Araneus ventricosus]